MISVGRRACSCIVACSVLNATNVYLTLLFDKSELMELKLWHTRGLLVPSRGFLICSFPTSLQIIPSSEYSFPIWSCWLIVFPPSFQAESFRSLSSASCFFPNIPLNLLPNILKLFATCPSIRVPLYKTQFAAALINLKWSSLQTNRTTPPSLI